MTMSLIQFWSDLSPLAWFGLKFAQVAAFVLISIRAFSLSYSDGP